MAVDSGDEWFFHWNDFERNVKSDSDILISHSGSVFISLVGSKFRLLFFIINPTNSKTPLVLELLSTMYVASISHPLTGASFMLNIDL